MTDTFHSLCFLLVLVVALQSCSQDQDVSSSASDYTSDLQTYKINARLLESDNLIKSPDALSIAGNGNIYIVDMGHNKPLSIIGPDGGLLYRFGERGSGPGQLGSIRDIVAPTKSNDTTYVIEFDKKAIFAYIDSLFVRQYPIPGEGYPRYASLTNTGSIMLGYVNSNTQAREINLTTGAWIDSSKLYTYPEPSYPSLPEGGEMDLFKGYVLKDPQKEDVYLFSMNTDALQVYSEEKGLQFLTGPTVYTPKFSDGNSSKPINKFRAFGRPLSFCNNDIIVGYSGEYKDSEHKQYYQSSSLLNFDPSKGSFTSRLLIEPDLRWNYGAIDCERELLYIIDQNFDREGASIYQIDFSDSPFFD